MVTSDSMGFLRFHSNINGDFLGIAIWYCYSLRTGKWPMKIVDLFALEMVMFIDFP